MDLWSIIYPSECLVCKKDGDWLCQECENLILHAKMQICPGCFRISENGLRHKQCANKSALNQLLFCAYYRDPLKQLLINAKYHYRQKFADIAVAWAKELIFKKNLDLTKAIIVPVPKDPMRFRKYGYHFSHIISKRLAKNLNIPFCDLLYKTRTTPAQTGQSRRKRISQLEGIIEAKPCLQAKKIFLIDDVATTGATLNFCAKALKKNHKEIKVIAIVIAHG